MTVKVSNKAGDVTRKVFDFKINMLAENMNPFINRIAKWLYKVDALTNTVPFSDLTNPQKWDIIDDYLKKVLKNASKQTYYTEKIIIAETDINNEIASLDILENDDTK